MKPYYSIYESNDIYSNLKKDYKKKNIEVNIYKSNDNVYILSLIRVPKDKQGQGIGKKVLQDIISIADKNSVILALTPTSEFGSNKNKLVSLYKQFGFKDNKGKDKDYSISETMIRTPK